QVVHRDRRRLLERQLLRLLKYLRRLHRDHLRLPTKTRQRNDRLADERTVHVFTNCIDDTADLVSHHARLRRSIRIQTLTRENVGEVQTRRTHTNDDLIIARCWIGLLLDLEHVDVAVCSRYDLSHRPILSVLIRAISVNLCRQYAHTNSVAARTPDL